MYIELVGKNGFYIANHHYNKKDIKNDSNIKVWAKIYKEFYKEEPIINIYYDKDFINIGLPIYRKFVSEPHKYIYYDSELIPTVKKYGKYKI